jgi:hypothetical protein
MSLEMVLVPTTVRLALTHTLLLGAPVTDFGDHTEGENYIKPSVPVGSHSVKSNVASASCAARPMTSR